MQTEIGCADCSVLSDRQVVLQQRAQALSTQISDL